MKIDFQQLVAPYYKDATQKLQKLVQIPSVYDRKTKRSSMPFGEEVDKALQYVGAMAERDGFSVDYCDGYCTEISYGSGPVTVGIFAHLDVVPATGKWDYPPFGGEIDNEIMYGRGTSDDKGPGLAAYFALRALKDAGLIDNYKVVLVFGGNEETGAKDLDYYFQKLHKPAPTYGFTPDAEFPLIYGEKAIATYKHQGVAKLEPIISIEAGEAANLVIDEATAILKLDKNIEKALVKTAYKYEVSHSETETTLTFFGISAHGSMPELGENAGLKLFEFLGSYYGLDILSKLASLYQDSGGRNFDGYYNSSKLGETTYNVGLITYRNEVLSLTVNFRYPEITNIKEIIAKLNELDVLKVRLEGISPHLYFDPNSDFIKLLLNVYQQETGDYESKPKTIGGGTYAKSAPNTIAFGSAFPGRNDLIHAPNEHIHLEDYYKSMVIYAHAIYALGSEL